MSDEKKILEDLVQEKKALQATIKEMEESNKGLVDKMVAYEELGSPEQISEALDKILEIKRGLGESSLSDVDEMRTSLEAYKAVGDVEVIEEALDRAYTLLSAYKELGSPEQVSEALDSGITLLKEYKELGSPKEIGKVLETYETTLVETRCDKLATKYNTTCKIVNKMYESISDFTVVEELLEETFSGKKEEKKDEKLNESKGKKEAEKHSSAVSRICKSLM